MVHKCPGRAGRAALRLVLACGGSVILGGVLFWMRAGSESLAQGQTGVPPAVQQPVPPSAPPDSSDYAQRVVACLHNSKVTRQDLGEYLVARFGADKLDLLINKRIIEYACNAQKIDVTTQEIEADLADTVNGMALNPQEFVDKVLKAYRKNLCEWKEDMIRPKLLLTKLVQNRITPTTEPEISMAFEAQYGEKLVGRIIVWPTEPSASVWLPLKNDEMAFARAAKSQANAQLAANEGRLDKPVGRYTTGNPALEDAIFQLLPGQASQPIKVTEGYLMFRCDQRLPGDSTASIQAKREELIKGIIARKTQDEIQKICLELKRQANAQKLLPGNRQPLNPAGDRSVDPVAVIFGREPITRQDLGEFLIARYGADNLELLVNRRIIEEACQGPADRGHPAGDRRRPGPDGSPPGRQPEGVRR